MLHDLRRTLATKIRSYGVPQRDVAKLLNHATNTVTDRYDLYDMLSENPDTMNAWNFFLTKVTTDTTDDRSCGPESEFSYATLLRRRATVFRIFGSRPLMLPCVQLIATCSSGLNLDVHGSTG